MLSPARIIYDTVELRARLRTAPIRSRERQRADAQLFMTFCLFRARAQLPRFVAVVEHQVRQSDGQRNESQQGDARRRAMCLGGPVLLDDLLGLVERNVEVLASRFNSPPGRVEVGRGSWPQWPSRLRNGIQVFRQIRVHDVRIGHSPPPGFGIITLLTGCGLYVLSCSSVPSPFNHYITPCGPPDSMSSKLTSSTPGAPSLDFASL